MSHNNRKAIKSHLAHVGITDAKTTSAFLATPRHLFVPKHLHHRAYDNTALDIGHGQSISQPSLVALMTKSLELKSHEKILEIGTGSGYQTAILSHLAHEIWTIERIKALSSQARKRFLQLKLTNIHTIVGDGYYGLPEKAPFDAIIITASTPEFPKPLINQLKNGGHIIAPIVTQKAQELILGIKKGNQLKTHSLGSVLFVPLITP